MSESVEISLYSPRWGHEDSYTIELHQDFLEISLISRTAKAVWVEGGDPEWQGETVQHMMENDSIYPPAIVQDLFEYAWKAWRDGELNTKEVESELQQLAAWINTSTRAKPSTDFWNKHF